MRSLPTGGTVETRGSRRRALQSRPGAAMLRTVRPAPCRAALPARFEPQLAALVKTAPEGDAWLHEMKFDGYRIGCRIDGADVRLLTRSGQDWTAKLPEVAAAARRLRVRTALLDGEVAVVRPDGRTSFQALQQVFGGGPRAGLVYFVFDLLHRDGEDLTPRPLEERKRRLVAVVRRGGRAGVIRVADHVVGEGGRVFAEACRLGFEGIVSKRRADPYVPGRHGSWLKVKCVQRQEFVIGGFTDPEGSRAGIGALLVGVHDASRRLVFAGKVGTGFTQRVALDLRARLEALERRTSPFATPVEPRLARVAHWVAPRLVAEVAFTEWTADGRIRHPSFQGLRADKPATDVVAERPGPATSSRPAGGRRREKT